MSKRTYTTISINNRLQRQFQFPAISRLDTDTKAALEHLLKLKRDASPETDQVRVVEVTEIPDIDGKVLLHLNPVRSVYNFIRVQIAAEEVLMNDLIDQKNQDRRAIEGKRLKIESLTETLDATRRILEEVENAE